MAYSQSSQASVQHEEDIGSVATGSGVRWIQELLGRSDAISHRLISELETVHGEQQSTMKYQGQKYQGQTQISAQLNDRCCSTDIHPQMQQ